MTSSKIEILPLNENNPQLQYMDSFEFFSGEDRVLKFQLWHPVDEAPYILDLADQVSVSLPTKSGFDLEKIATIDAANTSICSVDLTSANTKVMISGNIVAKLDQSSAIRIARSNPQVKGLVLLAK